MLGFAAPAVDQRAAERRAAELMIQGLIELENCRRNALYYAENFCWTQDEHNQDEPEQPLLHGDHVVDRETLQVVRALDGRLDDYLRYTVLVWIQVALMGVPKSRQLRLTHLMVALHGWLARFYTGQRVALQSKKFEDADALLERLHQSWLIQKKLAPHVPWPDWKRKEGAIVLPHGSIIMAIPQGSDVLRSYTFSAIMSDEQGFQDKAEESYTAAIPTIEGGGKFTAISSANPGFFQQIVFDKMEVHA